MAKSNKEKEEVLVDVEQVYSKTEDFIEKNKMPITAITIAVIVLIGVYYGYKKIYMEPLEEEAISEMFMAELYFEKDSTNKAIYGDGQYLGFIDIIDNYGSTKSGNLAHYYLGICYLQLGQFEDAIDELENFSSDDIVVSSIAKGATGDAYMELGETDKAISKYKQAAHSHENKFSSPIYLMKAAQALETLNKYEAAFDIYAEIKENFPDSQEGRQVDKYMARAESFVN